jgi:hypothetical protein
MQGSTIGPKCHGFAVLGVPSQLLVCKKIIQPYNWGNVHFGVAVVPTPGVQENHSSFSKRTSTFFFANPYLTI